MDFIARNTALISYFETAAREKKLSHAYLFHGPSSVGKATFALRLARLLENDLPETTRVLSDCLHISSSGDIGIDDVRGAQAFLRQKPFVSPYRTLIIDGADSLTHQASNALLKTLEEPHRTSLIFLIASSPDSLSSTILSRVQQYYFAPLLEDAVREWLVASGISSSSALSLATASAGLPGLAWRMAYDESLKNNLAKADLFLRTAPSAIKNTIKELVADDDFSLKAFVEPLLLSATIAYRAHKLPASTVVKIASFDRLIHQYNVSPRIQLTALLQDIAS